MESELPTIAEILASKDFLCTKHTVKVVKVGEKFVVKYGVRVSAAEGRNMEYVKANSAVPVPQVYGLLEEPGTSRKFLIMEYIPGQDLSKIMDELSAEEMQQVTDKLRDAVLSMRSIPPPGYIGTLHNEPCLDELFQHGEPRDPSISGPFEDEPAMNQGFLKNMGRYLPAEYLKLLRDMVDSALHDRAICFTHGDLQAKNIMVDRKPADEAGIGKVNITIIDWEYSGWYPNYFEFCNATVAARIRPKWLAVMRAILPTPMQEYLVMDAIHKIVFCIDV